MVKDMYEDVARNPHGRFHQHRRVVPFARTCDQAYSTAVVRDDCSSRSTIEAGSGSDRAIP